MELQTQIQTVNTATAIAREMLTLVLQALVTGATTAFVAGGLVVLLAINNA